MLQGLQNEWGPAFFLGPEVGGSYEHLKGRDLKMEGGM